MSPTFARGPTGSGAPDFHLRENAATVILYFFGMNEAFAGVGKAETQAFADQLTQLVKDTTVQDYSGKGPCRIVLVSPIAHEDRRDPNLPTGQQQNRNLATYTDIIKKVATTTNVGFADVFTPTLERMRDPVAWTLNGIHLNEYGHAQFATILDEALFGVADAPTSSVPQSPSKLVDAVAEKNQHWWLRYRAVNGLYLDGQHSTLHFAPDRSMTNGRVLAREREIRGVVVANRDQRIWDIASGKAVDEPIDIDDDNTPDSLEIVSNFELQQQSATGQLDYLSPAQAQKKFELADGYEINCFASEADFPELANPAQFAFDSRGRLWVICIPSYPHRQPKQPLNDKVLILEDDDGDGQADTCTVFADGLHVPTGIELGDGGVYVAQQPDLLFLEDTDADDRVDRRIRRLRGFGTADSHHAISAFVWGPGGALYFQEGTFHHSQIETPRGPVRLKNSGIFRYEPNTETLDVFVSYNFINPWGHVFDRWGQNFVADASGGTNYFGTAFSGRVGYDRKHSTMHQFLAKRFRPTTGCEIINSRHFPDAVQGNYLLANCIGEQGIFQHVFRDEGAGFSAHEVDPILRSTDRNFRPVDLKFGPDGALYVCDWHNALIGHMQHSIRDPNRDHSHGRVWRITYPQRPLVPAAQIDGVSLSQLVPLLASYQDETRYRVRRELRNHPSDQVVSTIGRWLSQLDDADSNYAHCQLEALWVHQHHNRVNRALLETVLESPDARARAAATRVVCYWRDRLESPLDLIAKSITDDHPRVRLEAIRACSFFIGQDASRAAEIALSSDAPHDDYLEYTLKETIDTLEPFLD